MTHANMKRAICLLLLAVVLAALDPAQAARQGGRRLAQAEQEHSAAPMISAERAVAIVRQRAPGRVLSVTRSGGNGGAVYRVKMLSGGGEVQVYRVDAHTGALR